MAKITEEEYKAAKLITDAYEKGEEKDFEYNLRRIHEELLEYFKTNLASGHVIKEFSVRSIHRGKAAEIVFHDPQFDEDYWDEKADDDFMAIGKKYGIDLYHELGISPK